MDSLRALIYGTQPDSTQQQDDALEERELNQDDVAPMESASKKTKKRKSGNHDRKENKKRKRGSDGATPKKRKRKNRGEKKHAGALSRQLGSDESSSSSDDSHDDEEAASRKPVKRVTMASSSHAAVHAATAARLDAAYAASFSPLVTREESAMPLVGTSTATTTRKRHPLLTAPPVVVSSASLSQPPPRHYSQPGRPPWKHNPLKAQKNLETPQQRELRLKKHARHLEYKRMQFQWKVRKYDLRDEEDVGGAMAAAAARLAVQKQKAAAAATTAETETQQLDPSSSDTAATASLEEEPMVEPPEQEDNVVVDTSDEEQDDIFNRLMKGSSAAAAAQQRENDESEKKDDDDDPTQPYAERFDYWQRGETLPVLDEAMPVLEFLQEETVSTAQEPLTAARRTALRRLRKQFDATTEPAITVQKFPSAEHRRSEELEARYLPLNHHMYATASFTQYRQVLVLAARHIMGVAGGSSSHSMDDDNVSHSNPADLDPRWIQALWNEQVVPAGHRSLVLYHANLLGRNLECYLQHEWKDRAKVAHRLGLLPGQQTVGAPEFVGTTLEPNRMMKSLVIIRKYLVRDESRGLLPWSPQDDDDNRSKSKSLLPTSSYAFVPGTVPPVPPFPLDATGMIFGPADKYVHVLQYAKVSQVTLRLTLSSLLSRYAQQQQASSSLNNLATTTRMDPSHVLVRHMQVATERAVALNLHNKFKWLENKESPDLEIPVAAYCQSLMVYCSLVLNCNVPVRKQALFNGKSPTIALEDAPGDDDKELATSNDDAPADDDDDMMVEEEESDSMETRVERLFEFCQGKMDHNAIQMFMPLHLVFGLLHIARQLPAPAIELIARPVNDEAFETPFDLMRSLLEYLESTESLVDTPSSPDKTRLMAGELEYALHQAARVFSRCVERDPTEVNYHCWYIAALSGSLLLCSGNRIGSRARRYPSSITSKKGQGRAFDTTTAPHEVRRRLPKFEHLRQDVARAVQLLSHLTKRQKGARAHLALSSFLEWRQVVALLVGPDLDASHAQICRAHQEHLEAWAYQSPGATVRSYLERRESERSVRLHELALILERDPSVEAHWVQLINALGPVGVTSSEDCSEPDCPSCNLLVDGRVVDHAQRRHESWWGKERQDWWMDHLLGMRHEFDSFTRMGGITRRRKAAQIVFRIVDKMTQLLSTTTNLFDPLPLSNHNVVESSLEWLNKVADGDGESETADLKGRMEQVDHLLPCTLTEMLQRPAIPVASSDYCESLQKSLKGTNPAWTLLTYQIVVAAHMYDLSHAWFTKAIRELVQVCYTGKTRDINTVRLDQDSDVFRCLRWLCQMGIDVGKLLPVPKSKKYKL